MKHLLLFALATVLIAGASALQTATAQATPSTAGTVVVKEDSKKTHGGVTVVNGSVDGEPHKAKTANTAEILESPPGSGKTTVTLKNRFGGQVRGIDKDKKVEVKGDSDDVTITGTGGTVEVGANCKGTVTNTSSPGGQNITVMKAGGGFQYTVLPGMSVPFNTH